LRKRERMRGAGGGIRIFWKVILQPLPPPEKRRKIENFFEKIESRNNTHN
jgi:hypothetical protein